MNYKKEIKEFILIRHGETDFNKEDRFLGTTDVSLNEKGRKQIAEIGKSLVNDEIDKVYSSDLKRCVETVEIINFACSINYSENLREMDFGIWEGLNKKKIVEKFKNSCNNWKDDWINHSIPEGESFIVMCNRVLKKFEFIKNNTTEGTNCVIVSHGGCIRAIIAHYILGDFKNCLSFFIDTGSITRLCFNEDFVYLKSLNGK